MFKPRLREGVREWVRDWALRYIERHPVSQEVRSSSGVPLIHRYNVLDLGPLHVRIHNIVASDRDRALHTHPWPNMTWVLHGYYYELISHDLARKHQPGEPFGVRCMLRRTGDAVFRGPSFAHRVILPPDTNAVTLFIHWNWGRGRRWGMWSEIDGSYRLVKENRQ